MKEEFALLYDQSTVGKAEVLRQGLYYRISCRYRLPSGEVCRLIIKWPGGWENVGIPVPEGDGFAIVKRIPVKKIPEKEISFHLIPAATDPSDAEHGEDVRPDTIADEDGSGADTLSPILSEEGTAEPERILINEDQPFEALDRLEDARAATVDGQVYAVFEGGTSQSQFETDGTMVGAEDVGIDRSADDLISEPV